MIPGKVSAVAEALAGSTTRKGKRAQALNPPGSETGGEVATGGAGDKQSRLCDGR